MNRGTLIVGLVLLAIGAAAGAGGMWWVLGGSAEPSEPISAPTLSLDATEEVDVSATEIAQLRANIDGVLGIDAADDSARMAAIGALNEQVASLSTAVANLETESEVVEATATLLPATETPEPSPTVEQASAGRGLYRINTELSEVRFILTEELFGTPKTVIGATDQIAGDIIVDFGNPANSQVGEIRINARTLETDDENRNRALRNQILQSRQDEFEFSTFVPTRISGLPEEPIEVGETLTFEITGDLTVRHITNTVTFTVTATLASEERLEGSASTMVTREAYELTIPNAPGVANVSNDVSLEISFVADLVERS